MSQHIAQLCLLTQLPHAVARANVIMDFCSQVQADDVPGGPSSAPYLQALQINQQPPGSQGCLLSYGGCGYYSRCSSAFFEEERSALKQKRQKIRLLQQRKVADVSQFKDLPDEIPLPLVIGTKVTGK